MLTYTTNVFFTIWQYVFYQWQTCTCHHDFLWETSISNLTFPEAGFYFMHKTWYHRIMYWFINEICFAFCVVLLSWKPQMLQFKIKQKYFIYDSWWTVVYTAQNVNNIVPGRDRQVHKLRKYNLWKCTSLDTDKECKCAITFLCFVDKDGRWLVGWKYDHRCDIIRDVLIY